MKTYWIRIGIVAVIVFALGMTGVTAARRGKQKLKELVTNGRLFNIPADIIPFQFEGQPIGSIRGMDLSGRNGNRERPLNLVVHLDQNLAVTLKQAAAIGRLKDCQLTADSFRGMGQHSSFHCANDSEIASRQLVVVGQVRFEPNAIVRDLLIPQEDARQLRFRNHGDKDVSFQLNADSGGAFMRVRDRNGNELFRLSAGNGGVVIKAHDEKGQEVVNITADSSGASVKVKKDSEHIR